MSRRLPRRAGVVPLERRRALFGVLALAVACFLTGAISPLGPALALACAIVLFGWVWPRPLAFALAGLLASVALACVLLFDERDAAAAIMGVYAAVFVAYALYERNRLKPVH
jgi:MFS family permease